MIILICTKIVQLSNAQLFRGCSQYMYKAICILVIKRILMAPEKIKNRQSIVLSPKPTGTPTPTPVRQTSNTQTLPLVSQQTGSRENFQRTSGSSYVNSLDEKTRKAIQDKLKKEYETLLAQLKKARKQNGPIGWAWDGIKNLTGLGAGSNKVLAELNNMKKQLADLEKNPANLAKVYKNIIGKDLSREEVAKLTKGQIESKAKIALNKYTNGQATAVDTVADVLAGIASGAMYAVALGGAVTAPFTGGASLAVTLAAIASATAVGAAVKAGIKGADAAIGGRKYTWKDCGRDALSGAVNGPLSALTAGMGCGLAQVAGKFGLNVAETAGKEVVVSFGKAVSKEVFDQFVEQAGKEILAKTGEEATEEAAKQLAKQMLKELPKKELQLVEQQFIQNASKEATQHSGNAFVPRLIFNTIKGAADGTVFGSISGSVNYLADCGLNHEKVSLEKLGTTFISGAAGGALFGGALSFTGELAGTGFKSLKNHFKGESGSLSDTAASETNPFGNSDGELKTNTTSKPIAAKKPELIKQMESIKDSNGVAILDRKTISNYIKMMEKNPNFKIEELSQMLNEIEPGVLKKYEREIFGMLTSSGNPVAPSEFLARKFNYRAELDAKFDSYMDQGRIKELFDSITSNDQLNFVKKLSENNVHICYLKDVFEAASDDLRLQDLASKIKASPGYSDGRELHSLLEMAKISPESLEKMEYIVSNVESITDTDMVTLMRTTKDLTLEKLKEGDTLSSLLPSPKKYIQDFLDMYYSCNRHGSKYDLAKDNLLANVNENNASFVRNFLQKIGGSNLSVDDFQKLTEVAKLVNAENKDVLIKWSNLLKDGKPVCSLNNFKDIAGKITAKNKAIYLKMAEAKSSKFLEIADKLTPETEDILLEMIEKKGLNNRDAYNVDEMYEVAKNATNLLAQNSNEAKIIADIIKSEKVDVSDKITVLKNLKDNTILSENYLTDLKKIMNGEPIIKDYKANTPIDEIIKDVPHGDVVQVGNKLYVNDDGNLVKLRMTKEKYLELFPPGSRFNINQKALGDCWLVSALDSIMNNPKYRAKLYQIFRQEGNDIYIKFPDGKNEIKFENSKIIISSDGKNLDGSLGLQMIEQAYSIHRMMEYPSKKFEDIQAIKDINQQMEKLHEGFLKEALQGILGTQNVKIIKDNISDTKKFINIIENYSNNPDFLLSFGTIKTGEQAEKELNIGYDLYSKHAYSIKHYNEQKGIVYIANPWHTSIVTEVPIEDLIKYINHILVITM